MENKEYIEVQRKIGKRVNRLSIRKGQILMVEEGKRGTLIRFLLHDDFGPFATIRCAKSYDEVMAMLNIEQGR